MVPTSLFTFYRRGFIYANSTDGSFSIVVFPRPKSGTTSAIMTNSSPYASTTWDQYDWDNLAAFQGIYGNDPEYRVVAGGVRVMPSISATSAPGEVAAGALPTGTVAQVLTLNTSYLMSTQYGHYGSALDGAVVTTRPQDLDSFGFDSYSGLATNSLTTWSTPFVSGQVPASTRVYYEAILHVEVLPNYTSVGTPNASGDVEFRQQLSNLYGSVENMFYQTEAFLEHSVKLTSRFANLVGATSAVGGLVTAGLAGTYLRSNTQYGRNLLNQ